MELDFEGRNCWYDMPDDWFFKGYLLEMGKHLEYML